MFKLQIMIEKLQPDLLTLSTTFYDGSVSRNLFLKSEMRQFGASGTEGLSRLKTLTTVATAKLYFAKLRWFFELVSRRSLAVDHCKAAPPRAKPAYLRFFFNDYQLK